MFNFYYEIWQPSVDYNNNIIDGYFISNKGNLRSFIKCKKGKTLRPYTKAGTFYKRATLSVNGKAKHFYVHTLVALAFPEICGKYREGLQVDHKNGIQDDNRAENLWWCTNVENVYNQNTFYRMVMHSVINLQETRTKESIEKLKKAKTKKIICIETGKLYSSRFEAAKELCVNPDSVWLCCSGRHKKTRNGYSFRFA